MYTNHWAKRWRGRSEKVVMRPSAGTGAGGAEAKEANAPAAESATTGPAASTPKGSTEKSPEAKE